MHEIDDLKADGLHSDSPVLTGTITLGAGTKLVGANGASVDLSGCTLVLPNTVLKNPMSMPGDMIVGGAAGLPTRLPVGAEGNTLLITKGNIVWGNNAAVSAGHPWSGLTALQFAVTGGPVDYLSDTFNGTGFNPTYSPTLPLAVAPTASNGDVSINATFNGDGTASFASRAYADGSIKRQVQMATKPLELFTYQAASLDIKIRPSAGTNYSQGARIGMCVANSGNDPGNAGLLLFLCLGMVYRADGWHYICEHYDGNRLNDNGQGLAGACSNPYIHAESPAPLPAAPWYYFRMVFYQQKNVKQAGQDDIVTNPIYFTTMYFDLLYSVDGKTFTKFTLHDNTASAPDVNGTTNSTYSGETQVYFVATGGGVTWGQQGFNETLQTSPSSVGPYLNAGTDGANAVSFDVDYFRVVVSDNASLDAPLPQSVQTLIVNPGDIITGGPDGLPLAVAKGTAGQVLSATATGLAWINAPTGGGSTPVKPSLLMGTEWYDQNVGGNPSAWFDGDKTTFVDASGNYRAGYDFGQSPMVLDTCTITARPSLESRASGVQVQGSQSAAGPWTTLATVAANNSDGTIYLTSSDQSTAWRYIAAYMQGGYGNLCEVQFYGVAAGQSAAPADPIAAANPAHRYQAANCPGANGAAVSTWPDSVTALGINLTNGSAAKSGNALQFGGSAYMRAAGFGAGQPYTLFIAFNPSSASNNLLCFGDGYGSGLRIDDNADGTGDIVIPNVGGFGLAGTPFTINAWHTLALVQTSAGMSAYVDGAAVGITGNPSVPNFDTLGIGGSGYRQFTGLIGEVALFNGALTAAQIASFNSYVNRGSIYQ